MSENIRGTIQVKGFQDEEMDFQLIRQLGSIAYGAASAGEVLAVAGRIKDGDPKSWEIAFSALGEWQMKDGDERASKGHGISARDQWFKACNSFRAAEYYTSICDPRHRELGLKSRACFIKAMNHASHTFEAIMLPYKEKEYPIYFMAPDQTGKKRKTLLIVSGFDGTLEEEYFMRGRSALERDYNILLFTGPGQMDAFRFYSDTYFEPDFENVVKNIVDYALTRPEVDPNKLALMGISFGGYFVTRAAAHEPRIKALIPNSPIVNLRDYLLSFVGEDPEKMPDSEDFTVADIEHIPENVMSIQIKSMCEGLMTRFGQETFKKTFIYLHQFVVGDAIFNIQCPSLAMVGEGEAIEAQRQYKVFCEKVRGRVKGYLFTDFEGAGTHCQVGNTSFANGVALDWLDELFA